ncbi:MAG TPA: hypothetical protein VFD70_07610 [Anaerolineae bacterium]|nr:hypothetical protein [Anaerolineae bacterium]
MIVLDENLSDSVIVNRVAEWYSGQVILLSELRPRSVIKDEAIPTLLLKVAQPTFVTINATDFWKRTNPHRGYCIVCVTVSQNRASDALEPLYRFFHHPLFKVKSGRMGKIVRLLPSRLEYYAADRKTHELDWQV